jgi:hypothetical protein
MIQSKLLTKFAFSLALALAVVAIVTSVPVRLEAQAVSGDLTGKVTDASGAVVPNATVEAVNLATGQKITTTTNSSGEYHFVNMPVGHYKVTASGNGLSGGYADVRVDLNKTATANISATVGAASTTVEVVSEAATIDTTTSHIQTNYDSKQVEDLPTASVGLGVLNLSLLQAGVGSSGGIGAGTGPSVSGQRPRNNNFTIEGVDNNDKSVTGPLATVPNDAVDSFTVLQNNFSPEFGHSSGGQFNTTIKSGTNKFHGRAYEYFNNRNLNAQDSVTARNQRNSKDPNTGNPVPVENTRFDNNRFGGQVGGPIVKDKLFFFTNWEYNPEGLAASNPACAPTAAGYALLSGIGGVSANNLSILKTYLPAATLQAGPDDSLCFQSSQVGGVDIPTGPIAFTQGTFINGLTTANSVDFNPTAKDQVRFRYVYVHTTSNDTAATNPTFWIGIPTRVHFGSLSEYHTFSPKVTNEFRLGFNRSANSFPVGPQKFPGLSMFPNITIDELSVNIGPDGNAPQFGIQNTYQLSDNVSWLLGKHNLKFGVEGRKVISPQSFTQRARGDYYYCGDDLGCSPYDSGQPNAASGLENFLLDYAPEDFGERSTGNVQYAGDQYSIYAFGNDEWRVTSHLTLSLGLRYEFTGTPAGTGLQALNSVSDVPGLISFHRPVPQKKNFAPRVGFAYSPGNSGNTSIRGGFAMAYDVIYDNLPILSFPPQASGTCDVGSAGGACQYATSNFLANGGLPVGSGSGISTFPTQLDAQEATAAFVPDQKLPYSESWNIGIQHVFAKKYIAEVRYVGTKGIHLPVQARINRQSKVDATHFLPTYLQAPTQATIDSGKMVISCAPITTGTPPVVTNGGCPSNLSGFNGISNYVGSYASAGFDAASVVAFQPYGSSIYHGLQSQVTRNFTNGIQFQAAWTWSHMFDNSTADVFSTVLTPRRAQDWNNFAGERSASALDHRHRVSFSMVYDMPFFKKDNNWFKRNLIGNWEVAPIYTFQTPEYATVRSGVDSNLNGDAAGDRTIINLGGVDGTSSAVTKVYNSYYTTACAGLAGSKFNSCKAQYVAGYVAVDPNARYIQAGAGALANASRNTLKLPRINNWDVSALKKFTVREGMEVDFGAQALNLFNHAQHVPGSLNQINSIGYTSTEVTNALQVGSANFGDFNTVFSNQPRSLGLSLKFIF